MSCSETCPEWNHGRGTERCVKCMPRDTNPVEGPMMPDKNVIVNVGPKPTKELTTEQIKKITEELNNHKQHIVIIAPERITPEAQLLREHNLMLNIKKEYDKKAREVDELTLRAQNAEHLIRKSIIRELGSAAKLRLDKAAIIEILDQFDVTEPSSRFIKELIMPRIRKIREILNSHS